MISFDVFDTLITRKTIFPEGIFLLVQDKLKNCRALEDYEDICKNFKNLRMKAEQVTHKGKNTEITFENIYEKLQLMTKMPDDLKKFIMDLEIQSEIDNSYPITKNIDFLKELYNEGEKIVLISDMYLSEKVIRTILVQWDDIFAKIPIYVSAEWKNTKSNGLLFWDVANEENCSFQTWIHYGDNKVSDYLMPKMLGIDARWLPQEELTVWENELKKKIDLNNNLQLQYLIGAARIVRMENKLNAVERIGASLGGILLYPYVTWIIERAKKENIHRLYFIARDGYVLKKIADEIIEHQNLNISTKYIYGSRKAWRTDNLSEEDKSLVLNYIEQEIDFTEQDYAFVDLYGTGYTMECLFDIISSKYSLEMKVIYYNFLGTSKNMKINYISFCSEKENLWFIEIFGRAPHGVTLGYRKKNGIVEPIVEDTDKNMWKRVGLIDYIKGVELLSEKLASWLISNSIIGNPTYMDKIIDYCIRDSKQEILEFIGDMQHSSNFTDKRGVYAPKLTKKDIYMCYMYRTFEPIEELYHGENINLSIKRTGKNIIKWKEFFESHYDGILGKVVQLYKNRNYWIPTQSKKRIIIYGAGKIGNKFHRHLLFNNNYKIVAWSDMNPGEYTKERVVSLKKALDKDFDYIVIAIANKNSYENMCQILQHMGIEKECIKYYTEFL